MEGYVTRIAAGPPSGGARAVYDGGFHGSAVGGHQGAIERVVAGVAGVGSPVLELCVAQQPVVVIERTRRPGITQLAHVGQVDHIVGITQDVVAAVVKLVDTYVDEASEGRAEDEIENGNARVDIHSRGRRGHRGIKPRAVGIGGRGTPEAAVGSWRTVIRTAEIIVRSRDFGAERCSAGATGIGVGTRAGTGVVASGLNAGLTPRTRAGVAAWLIAAGLTSRLSAGTRTDCASSVA